MKTESLYIHIPFCDYICSYCDFCKVYYKEELVETYLKCLKKELEDLQILSPLKTIYIGGGTPSSLNVKQLRTLMAMIQPYININTKEVCMEMNPESMSIEKLEILKKGNINRLSIGVQTFHEEILKKLERKHTNQQVFTIIDTAKQLGFKNISIDLMYGLPDQKMEDIQKDIEIVKLLDIQHISYYSLILEEHTMLDIKGYKEISQDVEDEIYRYVDANLERIGFKQYEVSNYARKGYQSQHNLAYWKYHNYYGIGVGATGKINNRMYIHSRNVFAYINDKDSITVEEITKEDTLFNHIMMSLRLLEGLDIVAINQQYKIDFEHKYQKTISKYIKMGWLHITNNKLHCDKKSLRYLHSILLDFID